jgi:hypothetical protein
VFFLLGIDFFFCSMAQTRVVKRSQTMDKVKQNLHAMGKLGTAATVAEGEEPAPRDRNLQSTDDEQEGEDAGIEPEGAATASNLEQEAEVVDGRQNANKAAAEIRRKRAAEASAARKAAAEIRKQDKEAQKKRKTLGAARTRD